MKIDTEKIENKKFAVPIEAKLQKYSQEYRVLSTLRYLFPNRFEKMVKGEAPDLQDKENGIGIEVTVAADWRDMRAAREFAKLQQENGDIEKCKKAITSSGYFFFYTIKDKVAIYTSGTLEKEKAFFQESIRKKINNLEQYRAEFQKIGLAVIWIDIPTSDVRDNLGKWIAEVLDKTDIVFDFVYVLSHRFCVYYDVQEQSSELLTIKDMETKRLATIARMTAEGELSLNDEEWQ